MEERRLNIAMIGSKGLPSVFGGIERHIEQMGQRLVARGHTVTVFGRSPFSRSGTYLGMKILVLPSIPTKNLDTATNALFSCFKAISGRYDLVHFHGIGPSIFVPVVSRAGLKAVATIHALDYRQLKWGRAAKGLLRRGERNAVLGTDASIAVSRLMSNQLTEKYGREVRYIPNGAVVKDIPPFHNAASLGLEKGRYILTVGRFIVERGFHTLIEAFRSTEIDLKLVIVGDERFAARYSGRLRKMADDRVLFPGYLSGEGLDELYAHCAFYVLPSLVEGLPISLMEAMSFSRPVLISDIPENLEVAKGIACTFRAGDAADLAAALRRMLAMSEREKAEAGKKARSRIELDYNWDTVTDELEGVYFDVLQHNR